MNDQQYQHRQHRLDLIPYPFGDDFARGIFQAADLIEVEVIQPTDDGIDDALDLAVIDQVPLFGRHFPFHHDIEAERMPVQPPALVPVRKRRQIVRCFKTKRLGKANGHSPADSTEPARRAKWPRS
jgi:hypothetical protein